MENDEQQDTSLVTQRLIEDEMKQSYLDYAMSVIVGRALPDARDGLKPVHRRILYAMHELGLAHNKSHKKSARIVGEVLGKYHPHGDTAVYDTMVRMAQDFALRYPLIDGQGNFGNIDGDSAAAMRYTEARMTIIAEHMLADIEKKTVDFRPNFDESLHEPIVLPAKFPNLLANGSVGIAVGMATNIPPHNITELSNAVLTLLNNPQCDDIELLEHIKGPDFPTGGIIQGRSGIIQAYKTGRGKLRLRAKTHVEQIGNRTAIIIDEIPYQIGKAALIEEIAALVREKTITGISDIRDESDRDGMRAVIELKNDANHEVVLNQLLKHTRLETTYGIIMLSLVNNIPRVLTLKEMLIQFINHRNEVVVRRVTFELDKANKRAHILLGLKKAIDQLDITIAIIRKSPDTATAKLELIHTLEIDEIQAQSILEMRLQRLTSMERNKIIDEYDNLLKQIADYQDILAKPQRVRDIIIQETQDIKEQFNDQRRTEIVEGDFDIDIEDLIKDEQTVITISRGGYCKRTSLDTYKAQHRGGKGIIGATTKQDDIVGNLFTTSTKAYLLCFTSTGKVHWLKAYQIPEASRTAGGKHIANLLPLEKGEQVTAFVPIRQFEQGYYLLFATKQGIVKKTDLSLYANPRNGGIKGIILDEGDQLIDAMLTDGKQQVILASHNGQAIRFDENDVRPMGRVTRGVRGMNLDSDDFIVSLVIAQPDKTLLSITQLGFGKRTPVNDYRLITRGGKGVINIQTNQRNGKVIGVHQVDDEDNILLISRNGIIIRTRCDQISVIGRNTQGVRIMRLADDDVIAGVSKIIQE